MPIQTMMSLKNHNDKNEWLPIQKNCDGISSKKPVWSPKVTTEKMQFEEF